MATKIPLAQLPPTPPNPRLDRSAHLQTDLFKALTLVERSDTVRSFMLDTSLTSDLHLLTTPRPAFTISTEEVQAGALPGCIAMTYLGIPAFTNQNGLSGGALVTTYTSRTHPLHAPTVMAAVRVGRYVRDNATGDWCFITRNVRDGLTRIQHISSASCTRERICLTCNSSMFDAGQLERSVLFQCHDVEQRRCDCGNFPCTCARLPSSPPPDLAEAAALVVREGVSSWTGTVRVTVVSEVKGSLLPDIDECMSVRSKYAPSIDANLAAHMQRLAIIEKANSATCIQAPICASFLHNAPNVPAVADAKTVQQQKKEENEVVEPPTSDSLLHHMPTVSAFTDVDVKPQQKAKEPDDLELTSSSITTDFDEFFPQEWPIPLDDSFFATEDIVDNIMNDPTQLKLEEVAMMPADPSTLPGGIQLCMEGMDTDCGWYSQSGSTPNASDQTDTNGSPLTNIQTLPVFSAPMSSPVPTANSPAANCSPLPQATATLPIINDRVPLPQQATPAQMNPIIPQASATPPSPLAVPTAVSTPSVMPNLSTSDIPAHVAPTSAPTSSAIPAPFSSPQVVLMPAPPSHGSRLAPRPKGMPVANAGDEGFVWQMGMQNSAHAIAMASYFEAKEKERRAEERRKKNRQAAARSNARKKCVMDGIRSEINNYRQRALRLKELERKLRSENLDLKRKLSTSRV